MGVPLAQMATVARYVLEQKLRGVKRYPLVLMLEPLFQCNLACAGCGKIQYPRDVLLRRLTPEQCFAAAEECPAPIISIPGGEPLLHPEIDRIADGLVARRRFVYLCTNALRLEQSLPRFRPSRYFAFSVHLDGLADQHDQSVCRPGVYGAAIRAVRAALARGFRVTTNTTLFLGTHVPQMRRFFDEMMRLGVEGMMISPGYHYDKAPDQNHFLKRQQTVQLFQQLLERAPRRWRFNQTALFLEFLQGRFHLECTPWGSPTYNIFGWQRPCYLLNEGYCATFAELMETTDWSGYGYASGNTKCSHCMVHCGHEPSAIEATFGSWHGMLRTITHPLRRQRERRCGTAFDCMKHHQVDMASSIESSGTPTKRGTASPSGNGRGHRPAPASLSRDPLELPVIQPQRDMATSSR